MSVSNNFAGKVIDYFSNAPLPAVNAIFGVVRSIVQARNKAAEQAAAPVKGRRAASAAAKRGRPSKQAKEQPKERLRETAQIAPDIQQDIPDIQQIIDGAALEAVDRAAGA